LNPSWLVGAGGRAVTTVDKRKCYIVKCTQAETIFGSLCWKSPICSHNFRRLVYWSQWTIFYFLSGSLQRIYFTTVCLKQLFYLFRTVLYDTLH